MEEDRTKRFTEQVKLADAVLGALVTVATLGFVGWTMYRARRAFMEVQRAYQAGADVGEIVADVLPGLDHEARAELERDVRRLEGRDG